MKDRIYTEKELFVNLNELAQETIRELYIAAKKTAIYSSSHPLARRAIGGPFMMMDKIFRYKQYFNLHLMDGHLYALNIRLKPSIFTDQIMDYMQILDISDILFEAGMTADQLALFLDRFVKRLPSTDYRNLMKTHLDKYKINTIHVDSQPGFDLFEKGHQFRGDLLADFSARNLVGQLIGDDFERLAELLECESLSFKDYLERFNLDYYYPLIAYLIPEKIASFESDKLVELLSTSLFEAIGDKVSCAEIDDNAWGQSKRLIGALNYHAERETILSRIGENLVARGVGKEIYSELLPKTSAIKIESSEDIDQFLYSTFNQALPGYQLDGFEDLFSRILRTGQQGKARSIINILINYLAGPDLDLRQKALILFRYIISVYRKTTDGFLAEHLVSKIDEYISGDKETFEFSDLIWELIQITMAEKNYKRLSSICDVLLKKRSLEQGIWSYESVAVKKSIEEMNRREVISQLINDLITVSHAEAQYIRNIMITIGSEQAALALSSIISHDSRQVRQHTLRILSEMGKSSLNVFNEILKDNSCFEREEGHRELPQEKWYVVRNCLFVLGSLKDPGACRSLRLRIADDDTRVRRCIIEALEKIGGEQAADLLLVIANDSDREIRKTALIALGFVGTYENVPEMIDLTYKYPTEIVTIINSIGKLGGQEAHKFLSQLLNDVELQSIFGFSRSSKDDIKIAALKALDRIGDNDSIQTIKEFDKNLSNTQKIFFGSSKLNKATQEILNRKDK